MTGDALHVPPDIPFGSEPAHDWCYYYQKASLARQIGDWNEVVRLGEEASTLELSPVDEIEWMPFLEGYAMQGKTDHVRAVIMSIKDIGVREQACALLSRLGTMQEVICAP